MKKYAIGADIGGSGIRTAIINLTDAIIVQGSYSSFDVDGSDSAENILSAWANALVKTIHIASEKSINPLLISGVGISMPGPFDYSNGICLIEDTKQKKFLSLYKMNIRLELAQRTGFKPENIRFKNDAECFLLGEVFGGSAQGSKRAIGITLGTGFGSAYWFDGQSEDANLWCAPFRDKTAEGYISTDWFVSRYKQLNPIGAPISGVKNLVDGARNKTNPIAMQIFDEFGESLRDFLVPLVIEKKPDTLVIGGRIAQSQDLFTGKLRDALESLDFPVSLAITILGEEAAFTGAASLLNE